MADMKNTVVLENEATDQVPFITKEIDGRVYTVRIHFSPDSKDTAKDKIKRLLKMEAESEKFSA